MLVRVYGIAGKRVCMLGMLVVELGKGLCLWIVEFGFKAFEEDAWEDCGGGRCWKGVGKV